MSRKTCLLALMLAATPFTMNLWAPESAKADAQSSIHILADINAPLGRWDLAAIDPSTNQLLVARGDGVMRMDLSSLVIMPANVPGAHVHAVVPIPETDRILFTNGDTDTATIYDAKSSAILAHVPTGHKPDAAIWDRAAHRVLVMNAGSGEVSFIDPVSMKADARVMVGGSLELPAVDGAGHAYINLEDRNDIAIVDTVAKKLEGRIPLQGCDEPTGIGLVPQTDALISACANNVAKLVDIKSQKIIGTLKIGKHPDDVLIDAKHQRAYIPCGEGSLTVLDTSGKLPAPLATIATRSGARTAALDERTGRIYLPYLDDTNGKHFGILVVGEK